MHINCRHGKRRKKEEEYFKALNKFFLEVDSKGNERARKAIKDVYEYAEEHFGEKVFVQNI